ncbi:DsbC family protein [Syntrophotalea carbinolica]|nr:DsbC family protein [Syntrophotalea carbinolica]
MKLLVTVVLLFCASTVWAFPKDSCGEKTCIDCHTLSKEEAKYLLDKQADKVLNIEPSQVQALWVVEVEKKGKRYPVYIDFTKNFVMRGEVLRLKDGENLTRERIASLNRIDVATIPLADALLLGKASASKKIIVFTDPQCSYCKKLHAEMKKVVKLDPDVAFYIKMLPLNIHPEAYMIAKSIVCNRSVAMLEQSFAGRPVPPPVCRAEAVDQTIVLARKSGINSTPTVVLPDGRPFSGYRDAATLLKMVGSKVQVPKEVGDTE